MFLSHTFRKAFGLAGIRFGYVVGRPTVIDAFNLMYLPWNLSLMAIAAAETILDTGEVKRRSSTTTTGWRPSSRSSKPWAASRSRRTATTCSWTPRRPARRARDRPGRRNDTKKLFLKTIKPINGKEGYFRVTPGTPEECQRFVRSSNYFGN